jgi:hypothetical protein
MPLKDPELRRVYQREYQREWKKRNPNKVLEYRKRHYGKYREYYSERAKRLNAENPEKRIALWRSWSYSARLKQKYGLSVAQFESLLQEQNHCCKICKNPFTNPKNRHVDHCHEANYVRGILCNKCNLAIGLLQNSPIVALEAAHYLAQPSEMSMPAQ